MVKFLLEMFNIKFEFEREVLFQINSFASFSYLPKKKKVSRIVSHVLHKLLMMFDDIMIPRFLNEIMWKVIIKQLLTVNSQQK